MNDPFPEELLSAYLDGELPGEERARVEEWLAASADHRRLFDDLQAIRRELQALPRQSLDTDFSDRVLAAIRERSGDSSASPPAASGASPTDAPEPTPSVPINKPASLPPRHLGMPAWRWFAAGVAATLAAVIVGMNVAPEGMAEIGKLALILPQEEASEGERARPASPPVAAPYTASTAPRKTAESMPGDSAGAAAPQAESRPPPKTASKDRWEIPADDGELRQQAEPGEKVPSLAEAPAPGAAPESFDRNEGGGRPDLAYEGNKALVPETANKETATRDDVVELPVTGEQADRALAFYAQALERQEHQSARRYSNVERVDSFGGLANEEAADEFAFREESEATSQRPAPGVSLMKLMDAAAQGVQVAALEVTGSEAEVQALLDSLGVAEARNLRPERALGMVGVRAMREGEEAATRGGPSAGPEAKPATALDKAEAKADGAAEQPEAAKEARDRRSGAGRGAAGGGFPTVKMKMERGFGGSEPLRDQVKRARDSQLEGLEATRPQLRVRLVIVPEQADPIGPTIEVKPAD